MANSRDIEGMMFPLLCTFSLSYGMTFIHLWQKKKVTLLFDWVQVSQVWLCGLVNGAQNISICQRTIPVWTIAAALVHIKHVLFGLRLNLSLPVSVFTICEGTKLAWLSSNELRARQSTAEELLQTIIGHFSTIQRQHNASWCLRKPNKNWLEIMATQK